MKKYIVKIQVTETIEQEVEVENGTTPEQIYERAVVRAVEEQPKVVWEALPYNMVDSQEDTIEEVTG